jgi:hypothetical protein
VRQVCDPSDPRHPDQDQEDQETRAAHVPLTGAALNAASSPAAAADIYVTDFERAGIPAASNREAAATAVAAACGVQPVPRAGGAG